MKILLLQPPSSLKMYDEIFLLEPLALEYLGAGLKMDGHEVVIHDARLEPNIEMLPGTDLYRERERELQSHNPALYDVFHAVLPTKLPLPDFNGEFAQLYTNSISLKDGLRTLMKYGLRRLWPQMRNDHRFLLKIRKNHLDHG